MSERNNVYTYVADTDYLLCEKCVLMDHESMADSIPFTEQLEDLIALKLKVSRRIRFLKKYLNMED